MSVSQLSQLAPLATVLPSPPDDEVLSAEQWTTLMAVAETVIPEVRPSPTSKIPDGPQMYLSDEEYRATVAEMKSSVQNAPENTVLESYLSESPANSEEFRREFQRTLACHIREDARKGIALVLSTLNTRVGSLLFNGTTTPFHLHPYPVRAALLKSWTTSYLPPLRVVSTALCLLVKSTWIRTSPTIGPLLSFPRAPVHGSPGKGYSYDFITPSLSASPTVLETDVVIIGSGCGAGVVAANLATDGHRVLVLEKAYHHEPSQLPMSELEASHHLYHGGGLLPSDDNSITVIAGSTWGGGGTVNWSASLQTQAAVRREWADRGLDFFTSAEFQASLDRVCKRMGVSAEHIEHNFANRMLLEGSRRLGYTAKAVPQNTAGRKHYCGYCTLGCGSCEKQGPVVSWFPDAMNAGAQAMEGLEVDSILFSPSNGKAKVATGVRGTWTSRDGRTTQPIIVHAKRVVLSAGSLFSPLVLLRSGLKNANIGRNLHLHPVNFVFGIWPEEIRPWEGGILTSVNTSFESLSPDSFHGAKLETMTMLPSWVLPLLPSTSLEFKKALLKFKHMAGFISLVRERHPGRVYPDAGTGLPRIAYTPHAYDRAHCLEGMIGLAKICYVMGATEIGTILEGMPMFTRTEEEAQTCTAGGEAADNPGVNDERFQAWIKRLREVGLGGPSTSFASAHQMGSCRMGTDERSSVVDAKGKVWGTEGLYVADASVFPSASGVNPMVTNMAISDWISRGVGRDLRREKAGGNGGMQAVL